MLVSIGAVSSATIIRILFGRCLVRFDIFKKLDDAGGTDGDEYHGWDVTVANIKGVRKVFFSVDN